MPVTLDQFVAEARVRVEAAKRVMPLRELHTMAADRTMRHFHRSVTQASVNGIAIIAELKLASPSQGQLRGSLHIGSVVSSYAEAGAAALSVLTEEKHFMGSLANLKEASAGTTLPCLRKDFIVDEYQIFEAKAYGADAVLLIAAALSDDELMRLHAITKQLGMDALCEVHDEDDLDRVRMIGAEIIGVNSRDLRTLEVDRNTHNRLAPLLPEDALRIAESGIKTGADVRHLRTEGYQAFLVGEQFMRADDPGAALMQMIGDAQATPLAPKRATAINTD
jgi:indole-3-glycerol phosphate synthase